MAALDVLSRHTSTLCLSELTPDKRDELDAPECPLPQFVLDCVYTVMFLPSTGTNILC